MSLLNEKIDQLVGMFDMWDTFATPYTDGMVLKEFGTLEHDGEIIQVTNHMMQSIIEFFEWLKKNEKENDKFARDRAWDLKLARRDAEYWKERALMNDSQISDLVQEYIEWAQREDGEENLQWTDVKLLEIVRSRMK